MTLVLAHSDPVSHALSTVAVFGAIAWYALLWWSRPGRRPGPLLAWTVGLLSILAATSPPFERAAGDTFTAHMWQHLVLLVVSAPLLVAAAPGRLWASGPRPAHRLGEANRRALRANAPFVAAGFFVATLAVTHLTSVYDLALRYQLVHDVEHAAYLGAAVGLWAAARSGGRHTASRRPGAVLAVIAGTALVSMVIETSRRPLIPTYADRLGDAGAVADQHTAAAIMWISGTAITLPLLVLAVWRWAAAEQRAALRQERLLESPPPRTG